MSNDKLIDAVLSWWQEHQYDSYAADDYERELYWEEPEFVKIAKRLRTSAKGGK
jgi:hypothetical protein